jgi:hypothetical protein
MMRVFIWTGRFLNCYSEFRYAECRGAVVSEASSFKMTGNLCSFTASKKTSNLVVFFRLIIPACEAVDQSGGVLNDPRSEIFKD